MKIQYSIEERAKVRETSQCIICGATLRSAMHLHGRIFCADCFHKRQVVIEKERPELCISCAWCGVESVQAKGKFGCEGHVRMLNDVFSHALELSLRCYVEEELRRNDEDERL